MIFHVNHLLADDSHDISSLNWFLRKAAKFENAVCCKFLAGTLRVNCMLAGLMVN